MASNPNAVEGPGLPPDLQNTLIKQELQLNLFQQENERINASLQRDIEIIKQRLLNLENQPPSIPTPMSSYSHGLRLIGEHEDLTKDNINSLSNSYPSDSNEDNCISGTEHCVSDQSKYELLHEEFIALKIDYQVLKFKQENPGQSIARTAGELTQTIATNMQLKKQICELQQELQQSKDAVQTLETKHQKLLSLRVYDYSDSLIMQRTVLFISSIRKTILTIQRTKCPLLKRHTQLSRRSTGKCCATTELWRDRSET